MILRQFLTPETACASYLFGCATHGKLGVVDPHASLVEEYLPAAEQIGSPIVAVIETHIQADHVSGLPELVARTGATRFPPCGSAHRRQRAGGPDNGMATTTGSEIRLRPLEADRKEKTRWQRATKC